MADEGIEEFKGWVWKPPYWSWRVRGLSNAILRVHPGRLTIASRFPVAGWSEVEYRWPAVVIQTLQPFGRPTILFEMHRELASCAVQVRRDALPGILERAGFAVVEVTRLGWEAPHRVSQDALGSRAQEVPPAVVS